MSIGDEITVRIEYGGGPESSVELVEGDTVETLFSRGHLQGAGGVLINGRKASRETQLRDDDVVTFLPKLDKQGV